MILLENPLSGYALRRTRTGDCEVCRSMGYGIGMTEDLSEMPIAEADRFAQQQIERCRDEMGQWRRARAVRVAQERDAGAGIAEIAAAMGVTEQVVYGLIREARKAAEEVG